jgi:SET family sugar efflux transporter-like MFS transporter
LGTGTAAFPQLFALARSHLDRGAAADAAAAARGAPALRSVWSLAWAIGPMVGGAVLARQGFAGLFLLTAVCFGAVALPILLLGPPGAARPAAARSTTSGGPERGRRARPAPARALLPVVLGFGLFHAAMFTGSIALPLYVTGALGRAASDVGLLFSICAVVEIPAALGLLLLPARVGRERVIRLGVAVFVGYFVLAAAVASMPVLVVAQAARGVAIAVVGALGITYFQDLLPDEAGRATTLFSNTVTAGSLVAGLVAGAAAQALGYRAALLLCGALSAAAWALLVASPASCPAAQAPAASRAAPAARRALRQPGVAG